MTDEKESEKQPTNKAGSVSPRPWIRFWARMFDLYLYFNLLAMSLALRPALIEPLSNAILGLICIFRGCLLKPFYLQLSVRHRESLC